MSLQQQIKDDVKKAMIAKESNKLITLRGILNAFSQDLDSQKKAVSDPVSDADAIRVMQKLIKQRKDSIAQFTTGNRPDLVEAETAELKIISSYVPAMMSKEEITKIAQAKKAELDVTDKSKIGLLMSAVMKELKGKADGADVKAVVESLL